MDRGKGGGSLRGGFRVFMVHVDRANMERLRQLFRDFADGKTRTKGALYYRDVWLKEWQNVLKMREEAGKRTVPNPPAALLPVRFVMPDGTVRGDKNAPCVIDLRRRELRIPSYGVSVPLRESVCRALIEENGLEPRPDFVLQVTRRGLPRIIASRNTVQKKDMGRQRTLLLCFDENTGHGLVTTLIHFDCENVKVARGPTFKPPNMAHLRSKAKELQHIIDTKATVKLFDLHITSERARDFYGEIRGKEKRLNEERKRSVVAWVRKQMRSNTNTSTVVLIDEVTAETANNGMARRVTKVLENLCRYEGFHYFPLRTSGRYCPKCGAKGVETAPRIFKCPLCGLEWHRDRCAMIRLAIAYARITKNERLEEALLQWIEEHPKALLS